MEMEGKEQEMENDALKLMEELDIGREQGGTEKHTAEKGKEEGEQYSKNEKKYIRTVHALQTEVQARKWVEVGGEWRLGKMETG